MKTLATIVTERGQVSIPAAIRKRMRIEPGQRLQWENVSDHECRIVVATQPLVPGAVAMLGYAATFRKPRATHSWLAELREGERK
jgi:AbrB family looped-hinge helix DNA binding protein